MKEGVEIELGLHLKNVPYIECTTMRKFGLNKSGYLISVVRDQYFYWTDLKKIKVYILFILTHFSAHPIPNSTFRVLKHLKDGESTSKQKKKNNTRFPIVQSPLFRAAIFPTSLLFLKISTQPPTPTFLPLAKIFNSHLQKKGGSELC